MLTADVAFKLMSLCAASLKVLAGSSARFSKSTTYSAFLGLQCTACAVHSLVTVMCSTAVKAECQAVLHLASQSCFWPAHHTYFSVSGSRGSIMTVT